MLSLTMAQLPAVLSGKCQKEMEGNRAPWQYISPSPEKGASPPVSGLTAQQFQTSHKDSPPLLLACTVAKKKMLVENVSTIYYASR